MTYRHLSASVTLVVASLSCSRQATEAPGEAPAMTPASSLAAPVTGGRPGCAETFQSFDENSDGRVTQDEFNAGPHARHDPAAVFRDRDRDGDGSLIESEFCSGWRGRPRAAPGPRPGSDGGLGRGRGRMPHRGTSGPRMEARCEQHFDAFDADRDGTLTREEFAAWPHVHGDPDLIFDERDQDRDGTMTRVEFCSAWSASSVK